MDFQRLLELFFRRRPMLFLPGRGRVSFSKLHVSFCRLEMAPSTLRRVLAHLDCHGDRAGPGLAPLPSAREIKRKENAKGSHRRHTPAPAGSLRERAQEEHVGKRRCIGRPLREYRRGGEEKIGAGEERQEEKEDAQRREGDPPPTQTKDEEERRSHRESPSPRSSSKAQD